MIVNKTVKLNLEGLDGNAFVVMGAFRRQAKREGWTEDEINSVLTEAKSSDYTHLLGTILDHCEASDEEEDDCDRCDDCGDVIGISCEC